MLLRPLLPTVLKSSHQAVAVRAFSLQSVAYNRFAETVERVRCEAKIPEVNGEELQQLMQQQTDSAQLYLVDVRERDEQAGGVIPGAICLPRGIVDRDIGRYVPSSDKRARLVLYCAGGVRSILAAESLQRIGYQQVASLRGGMYLWRGEGRPVVKV